MHNSSLKKMKENDDGMIGFFVSGPATYFDTDPDTRELLEKKRNIFRPYVWSELGVRELLKTLHRRDYGENLDLILFKFYLLPLLEELTVIKEIERYRPKERAIGIPIIIHDYNFFDKSDLERRKFLKQAILEKLDLLAPVIKRNKLDTNLSLLKADVVDVLS